MPLDDSANLRDDQRRPGWRSQVVQPSNSQDRVDHNDPALMSYPRGINPSQYKKVQIGDSIKYAKVVTVNEATGETVYSGLDLNGLKIIPI